MLLDFTFKHATQLDPSLRNFTCGHDRQRWPGAYDDHNKMDASEVKYVIKWKFLNYEMTDNI